MIDEVKAVNRMFAVLTLSFIHVSFYILSVHALIAHCHNRRFIKKIPPNLEQSVLGIFRTHMYLQDGCSLDVFTSYARVRKLIETITTTFLPNFFTLIQLPTSPDSEVCWRSLRLYAPSHPMLKGAGGHFFS